MKKYISVLFITFSISFCAKGQFLNAGGFANLFIGNWTGEGEFANGKKIAANLSFKMTLDSNWIMYEHIDKAPNTYKATSLWGFDKATGQFVAYIFDNFRGHRKFTGEGWKDNKLILTYSETHQQRGVFYQHFIYEKNADNQFKMTYETSMDGNAWKMGDWLVFTKMGN